MGRFFVGITGASGHAYAEALVRGLVAGGHGVDLSITRAGALSCEGRSAGGMLVAGSINEAPHLFCAGGSPAVAAARSGARLRSTCSRCCLRNRDTSCRAARGRVR